MRNLLLLICFFLLPNGVAVASPTAKITVRAVDESGRVIPSARVNISFTLPSEKGLFHSLSSSNVKGVTNNNGEFTASHEVMGRLGVSVDKEGYYQSGTSYEFTSESKISSCWEPWNPILEIILKKKRNPIAMYAHNSDWINIPVEGKPVGYDLEKGDWVSPYGKGVVSDFSFNFQIDLRAYRDYEGSLYLTFSNEQDGIQEYYPEKKNQSYYKWPFEAPQNGYLPELLKEKSDTLETGVVTNLKRKVDYIYRVRTKVDEKGNIVEAKYGKASGEFEFGRKGQIRLIYWYNPSGTRNLEFDPEQNLMKWSSRRDEQKHRITSP